MGAKIKDTKRKLIIADYIQTGSMRETARNYNVNASTVKRIVDEYKNGDILQQLTTQKNEQETKDIVEYMQARQNDTKRVLDKLLKGIEIKAEDFDDMDLKGLATAYGIILDKQLKLLELQRGMGSTDQLAKVQELLNRLDKEAQDDIK